MKQTLRPQRNVFLLFLGAVFVALMTALPLVVAQNQPPAEEKPAPQAQAQQYPLDHPSFEQADRNKDGYLDKSESGVIPGLSANFERADRNRDGKLDKAEFRRAFKSCRCAARCSSCAWSRRQPTRRPRGAWRERHFGCAS